MPLPRHRIASRGVGGARRRGRDRRVQLRVASRMARRGSGNDGPLLVAADWFGQRRQLAFDFADAAGHLPSWCALFPTSRAISTSCSLRTRYRADLYELNLADPARTPVVRWPSTRYTNQPSSTHRTAARTVRLNRDGTGRCTSSRPPTAPERVARRTITRTCGRISGAGRRARFTRSGATARGSRRRQQAVHHCVARGGVEVLELSFGNDVTDVHELPGGNAPVRRRDRRHRPVAVAHRDGSGSGGSARCRWRVKCPWQARLAFTQPALTGLIAVMCRRGARRRCCPSTSANCLTDPRATPCGRASRASSQLRPSAPRGDRGVTHLPTALGLSIAVAPDDRIGAGKSARRPSRSTCCSRAAMRRRALP